MPLPRHDRQQNRAPLCCPATHRAAGPISGRPAAAGRWFAVTGMTLAASLLGGGPGTALGQSTWSPGTTNWNTASNWSPSGVPTGGVIIDGSLATQPTISNAVSAFTTLSISNNPNITLTTFNNTVTASGAVTGSGGLTISGYAPGSGNPGILVFTNTGSTFTGGLTVNGGTVRYNPGATINTGFGADSITLNGGSFSFQGPEIAINTTTGLPTGGGGTDRSLINNIIATANGGTLNMNQGSGTAGLAVAYNTLDLRGTLTTSSAGGGNADGYTFAGTVTLYQGAAATLGIINSTGHNGADWIAGQIVDGAGAAGNALRLRTTNRTLQISNGANSYAGGTIIEGGGSGTGNLLVTSAGLLGTGNVTTESGARLRLDGGSANIGGSASIDAQAGSAVGNGTNSNALLSRFTSGSEGIYGIDGGTTHSYAIDLAALGNGKMFLGTINGGTFSGSLAAGSGNTYRLGGGSPSSNLTNLTLTGTNALTGSNQLVVGSGLNTNASYGRTLINSSQDFVGDVTVNTDGLLATRINGGTPWGDTSNAITVYGTLAASGPNGVFNTDYAISLMPGSSLALNNENYSNASGNNNNDRWGDATAVPHLRGAEFKLTAARSANTTETVGAITFNGNSSITLNGSNNSTGLSELTIASLTRQDRGVLTLTAQGTLGTASSGNSRLLNAAAPTVTNGIVEPWMVRSTNDFLTFSGGQYLPATYSGSDINTATNTSTTNQTSSTTLSDDRTTYALRFAPGGSNATLSASGTGTPFDTITVVSGGIILANNNANIRVTLDSGSAEMLIFNPLTTNFESNSTADNGQRGGLKTTGGLTKWGGATLNLTNGSGPNNYAITGGIVIQQGTIVGGSYFNSSGGLGGNLLTVNHEGRLSLNNVAATVLGLSGEGVGGNVFNSGANLRDLTIDLAAGTQTYEGRINQNINLVKTGSGTQVLTGTSGYVGTTAVNVGTLVVNGKLSSGGGLVSVAGLATLGGSGVIDRAVSVADTGILAPGNSPGTLTTGDLTLADLSDLQWQLGTPWQYTGANLPSPNDLVAVSGALVLDGKLTVSALTGFASGTYTLLTYTGTLTDNTLDLVALPSGYNGIIGIDTANKAVNLTVTVIPEPAALALIGLGGMLMLPRSRRHA